MDFYNLTIHMYGMLNPYGIACFMKTTWEPCVILRLLTPLRTIPQAACQTNPLRPPSNPVFNPGRPGQNLIVFIQNFADVTAKLSPFFGLKLKVPRKETIQLTEY